MAYCACRIARKDEIIDFRMNNKRPYFADVLPLTAQDTPRPEDEAESGTITQERPKTKRPSMYKVIMLNDDYTPQEFVVWLLTAIFNKSPEEATTIMLHVHQNGVGICGIYTYEVAETKVAQVMELARRNDHPLQCTMEKE